MGIIKFFSVQPHKRMNIKPRFHDPEMDRFKALREKRKAENGGEDMYVPNIKGKMKKAMFTSEWSREQRKKSNIRVFIIVITLIVMFAMVMARFSSQLISLTK